MTAPMMMVRARVRPRAGGLGHHRRRLDLLHTCQLELRGGEVGLLRGQLRRHQRLIGTPALQLGGEPRHGEATGAHLVLQGLEHHGVAGIGATERDVGVRVGELHGHVGAVGVRGDLRDRRLIRIGGARRPRHGDVRVGVHLSTREARLGGDLVHDGVTLQDGRRGERVGTGRLGQVAHHGRRLTQIHLRRRRVLGAPREGEQQPDKATQYRGQHDVPLAAPDGAADVAKRDLAIRCHRSSPPRRGVSWE